jgi:inositol phosphorylceramide mannosyltransferase catalytic subunit
MAIPKIIHQTLKNKSGISPILEANIQNLSYVNPNWDYRLYDDEDIRKFLLRYYGGDIIRTFDSINPLYGAARADFFRYLLMYEHGGVYLDIKSTSSRRLDDVLCEDDCFILSQWSNNEGQEWGRHPDCGVESEYQQWHIITTPRHPFLKSVISTVKTNIDRYNPIRDGAGFLGVLRVTGPIAYTLAIKPVTTLHKHRLVNIIDLGFQYSVFGNIMNADLADLYGGKHYSRLREPIVVPSRSRIISFRIQNFLLRMSRKIFPALLRRTMRRFFY